MEWAQLRVPGTGAWGAGLFLPLLLGVRPVEGYSLLPITRGRMPAPLCLAGQVGQVRALLGSMSRTSWSFP